MADKNWVGVVGIKWVLDDAPNLPGHLVGTLVAIARRSDPKGRNAYGYVDEYASYARKSRSQISADIKQLLKLGLLIVGDQSIVKDFPQDRKPVVYDLPLWLKRDRDEKTTRAARGAARWTDDRHPMDGTSFDQGFRDGPSEYRGPMDGMSRHPMDGTDGIRSIGHLKDGVKTKEEDTPLTPRDDDPDPWAADATAGEVFKREPATTESVIEQAIRDAVELRPSFTAAGVRKAINDSLASGRSIEYVVGAMVACYEDPVTQSPGRLKQDGPWWKASEVAVRDETEETRRRKLREQREAHDRLRAQRAAVEEADARAVPPNADVKALRDMLAAKRLSRAQGSNRAAVDAVEPVAATGDGSVDPDQWSRIAAEYGYSLNPSTKDDV